MLSTNCMTVERHEHSNSRHDLLLDEGESSFNLIHLDIIISNKSIKINKSEISVLT